MRRDHLGRAVAMGSALLMACGMLVANAGASASTAPVAGELWVHRFDGPGRDRDEARALVASPDGQKVFVTGYGDSGTVDEDYATFAYGASTGGVLWGDRYNGLANRT